MSDTEDRNKEKKTNDDWEFKVQPKLELKKSPQSPKSQDKNFKKQNQKLSLDKEAVPRTKTRSAMAMEMQGIRELDQGDVYTLAPVGKRAIAFILDMFFLAGFLLFVKMAVPFFRNLIQYFLDNYKLQFIVPESFVMVVITVAITFFVLYFFIVIPVAFFNHSFGKKILGLKVRGEDRYSISIGQAFLRELIMKPLGIMIIAGFITPLFSNKKLSIHDMVAHTFVIED